MLPGSPDHVKLPGGCHPGNNQVERREPASWGRASPGVTARLQAHLEGPVPPPCGAAGLQQGLGRLWLEGCCWGLMNSVVSAEVIGRALLQCECRLDAPASSLLWGSLVEWGPLNNWELKVASALRRGPWGSCLFLFLKSHAFDHRPPAKVSFYWRSSSCPHCQQPGRALRTGYFAGQAGQQGWQIWESRRQPLHAELSAFLLAGLAFQAAVQPETLGTVVTSHLKREQSPSATLGGSRDVADAVAFSV